MLKAEDVTSKRLDHHGIVSSVIQDLGIIEYIDKELETGEEEVTSGEAVAAMIINGLGFSDRPLSLTPQFFEQLPLEQLFGRKIESSQLNRHKLGRTLDKLYEADVNILFSKLAEQVADQEEIDRKKQVNDTTTFSVTGDRYNELIITKKTMRPSMS